MRKRNYFYVQEVSTESCLNWTNWFIRENRSRGLDFWIWGYKFYMTFSLLTNKNWRVFRRKSGKISREGVYGFIRHRHLVFVGGYNLINFIISLSSSEGIITLLPLLYPRLRHFKFWNIASEFLGKSSYRWYTRYISKTVTKIQLFSGFS